MAIPEVYWLALGVLLGVAVLGWVLSLWLQDVSFVDSLWSLFFIIAAAVYAAGALPLSAVGKLVMVLVTIWALRLSLHITARNWGEPEDSRYQKIRENNEPNFHIKSVYIVFGLQAVLAWIISIPLLYAVTSNAAFGPLQLVASVLWFVGFVFEAGGDWQLMQFRRNRDSNKAVLDSGLWRYTRHPNYFGDACIWWSFWLFAAADGAWWTIYAPVIMTFLLLKVSGVAMLEKTIGERRPEYADYIRRTSAFIPMPPDSPASQGKH